MRRTVTIDDELFAKARELTGLEKPSAIVKVALVALIQREAARRLALMAGTMPDLKPARRRRPGGDN